MAMFIRNSHQMPSSIGVLVQAVLFIISFIFTLIGVSTAMRFTLVWEIVEIFLALK